MVTDMSEDLTRIRNRLAEIDQLTQALDKEREELLIAERVVARLSATADLPSSNGAHPMGALTAAAIAQSGNPMETAIATVSRTLSQKALITSTLKAAAEPWIESSNALHEQIKKIHGKDIPKGSFQPLLWQLDKEGLIVRKDSKIALAERVKGTH
jgi:hypothetical protein